MTEEEWLACRAPKAMLAFLCDHSGTARRKQGRRKLRLLACACCRRVWHKLTEDRDRRMVLLSEDFADGAASPQELGAARQLSLDRPGHIFPAVRAAIATADPQPRAAVNEAMFGVCSAVASHGAGYGERWQAEAEALAEVVRELFGNPFRAARCERRWLTANDGAARRVAQAAYDSRDLADLPVVADALEEAGCDERALLGHLRSPGPHVRGCWALDLVLGKS
jgi:uncharacterized membrane protein